MRKKLIAVALAGLLLNLSCLAVAANPRGEREARRAERVRTEIARLGTGPEARIEVKLRDGRKLRGYVSEATADFFVVTDAAGAETRVPYPQVRQTRGHNLSTRARIAIGIAIVAGIIIMAIIVASSLE